MIKFTQFLKHNGIAKCVQNINVKYGILLEFIVFETPEVSHWVETFQVLMSSNIEQETQPRPVPTTNFSVPPKQVNVSLNHQQAEIDRLMQVMPQWSIEGPHQYHHTQANYNASRGRSCSTPYMSQVHYNRSPQHLNEFEHEKYGYQDRRYQHHHRQEPD